MKYYLVNPNTVEEGRLEFLGLNPVSNYMVPVVQLTKALGFERYESALATKTLAELTSQLWEIYTYDELEKLYEAAELKYNDSNAEYNKLWEDRERLREAAENIEEVKEGTTDRLEKMVLKAMVEQLEEIRDNKLNEVGKINSKVLDHKTRYIYLGNAIYK